MALRTGLANQFGLKVESVYGTPVTVDRFFYAKDFSVTWVPRKQRIRGMGAGMFDRTTMQVTNVIGWKAKSVHTVMDKSFGLLFKLCLGANTTAQVGATTEYTHSTSIDSTAAMVGLSATVQFGVADVSGTVRAFTLEGAKVESWTLKCDDGADLELTINWDAENCLTATALASASFPSGWTPFVSSDIAWTIGGSPAFVKNWTVTMAPTWEFGRRGMSTVQHKEPLWVGNPLVTFELNGEFESLTHYASLIAGTQQAFTMTATGDTIPSASNPYLILLTINSADFEGDPPDVSPEGINMQKLKGHALYDGSVNPLTVVVHNGDAAA